MTRLINLKVYCPNPSDITSLYRAVGPLSALRKQYRNLQIDFEAKLEYQSIAMADIVFLQRPFVDAHLNVAKVAKEHGIPVWADWDDNLFAIPETNPHYKSYASPKLAENIKQVAALADIVTVPTEPLKGIMSKFSNKVRVIPNALFDELLDESRISYDKRRAVIGWRGGQSHNMDLMDARDPIINISHKHKNWAFVFVGYNPFIQMKGIRDGAMGHFPNMSFKDYMKNLKSIAAPVHIVPLVNDSFNVCKSNIAWLEASTAGSLVIAPDMPEWKRPGIINYSSNKELEEQMERVIKSPSLVKTKNKESLKYIKDNLLLSKINKDRITLIEELDDVR